MESEKEGIFISKLIRGTRKGEFEWEAENYHLPLPANQELTSKLYTTELNGKKFRLYEYMYEGFLNSSETGWINQVRLEMVDDYRTTLYEFKFDYALYKLLTAIRTIDSDISNFIDDFINE